MTTPAQYREFAIDCLRWTDRTKDASQRITLTETARRWLNAASKLERHVTLASDAPALLRELRAKLD